MTVTQDRSTIPPPPDPPGAPQEIELGTPGRLVLLFVLFGALGVFAGLPILLVVLGLLVMIFFHELGHYIMAKRAGMKVTEFFLGFGPRIWSFQRGETEYGLKAIPAGAYVRIIGMNNLDEIDPADEQRAYRQKSFPQQLGVAVAGSTMHFLMAIVLTFIAVAFVGVPDNNSWFVNVVSGDSAAQEAGIREGDVVLAVDGQDVTDFDRFGQVVEQLKGQQVPIEVERDGEVITLTTRIGERLTVEGAATLDGLEGGDRIFAVDGKPVANIGEFAAAVEVGGTYAVTIDTGTDRGDVSVTVNEVPDASATNGFFGVGPRRPEITKSIPASVADSFELTGRTMGEATQALAKVFTPSGIADFTSNAFDEDKPADAPAVSRPTGPDQQDETRLLSIYGAVRLGGDFASEGLGGYLAFFIAINIFVGVFNLVPLLPLDGGHVVFATYERIRSIGRERYHADAAKLLPLTYAVVGLLLFVAVIALYRDIIDPISTG